ncbi:MAG: HEAT repeat domain-containing protein [Terriglobales bacterium]
MKTSARTLLAPVMLSLALASASPQTSTPRAKPEPQQPWQILTAGAAAHNPAHRAEAVAALGTMGPSRRVLNLIERALADKDPSIRQLAARILGEMRARSSVPRLRLALADDSPEVGFAAARSLWSMGDRTGRGVFIQILSGERASPAGLIKGGLDATRKKFQDPGKLAIIGAKEAASSLFGPAGWGIKVMEEVTQDRSASARAMSAILLGPDATLDALRELQDALNDKNWIVRAAAAQALGASRRRDQIPYLRQLLEDDKPAVRYMAAASILRLASSATGAAADRTKVLNSEARPALGSRGPNTLNEDIR